MPRLLTVSLFVRLWVEIDIDLVLCSYLLVSLFVRLWVEMLCICCRRMLSWSASSWGCELKYDWALRLDVCVLSASSWGCELKWSCSSGMIWAVFRQPLREAVSWNDSGICHQSDSYVSLFVRLWVEMTFTVFAPEFQVASASSWGCELKCESSNRIMFTRCQPLREAVSWNTEF